MAKASAQRGLWKLMLKLPAIRGELQIFSARNANLLSLCDAFEDASSMLEQLRHNRAADGRMIVEYQTLCAEIETEVVELCILLNRDDP